MMIEIEPSNRRQYLEFILDKCTRVVCIGIGLSVVLAGVAVLVLPGFEQGAALAIKAVLGLLLIAFGLCLARAGGSCKPVELAFDRRSQEWKLARQKGRTKAYESLGTQGGVLRVNGLTAAMHCRSHEPMFDFHLQPLARMALLSEAKRQTRSA